MPNPIFPTIFDWMRLIATQKKVFVTLKESHVLEIVLTAAASLNAPSEPREHFSTCLTLAFLLRKMTFTKKCFWQGDLDNRLPFRVEKSGLWSLLTVLSESWWISRLCPLWCARYLCFPVSYILVVLSIGHLYVLHRWISVILQNRLFSLLWLHIQTHNP